MSVKVIECKDYEEMSRVAAGLVADVCAPGTMPCLGLATGSTARGNVPGALPERTARAR